MWWACTTRTCSSGATVSTRRRSSGHAHGSKRRARSAATRSSTCSGPLTVSKSTGSRSEDGSSCWTAGRAPAGKTVRSIAWRATRVSTARWKRSPSRWPRSRSRVSHDEVAPGARASASRKPRCVGVSGTGAGARPSGRSRPGRSAGKTTGASGTQPAAASSSAAASAARVRWR